MTRTRNRVASLARIAGWNVGILVAGLIAIELIFGNWLFGVLNISIGSGIVSGDIGSEASSQA